MGAAAVAAAPIPPVAAVPIRRRYAPPPVPSIAAWPHVGRDADVATLVDILGRARGVVLTGEPGVGKTSLGRATLDRLAGDGWATATFEAGPAARAVPFLPFAALLDEPSARELDRMVDAARALAGRGDRVVALLDDAHALDDASLAFVSHLLAATDVRLVLTVRSGDGSARLVRAWADALARIEVLPLDRPTVDEVVRRALGDVDPRALRWLWDTTGGNPLFLRELVADAVERDVLVERAGRWRLRAADGPTGRRLQEVVADRFGSVEGPARDAVELLTLASPIGLRDLEALVGAAAVTDLERRGLIAASPSGRRMVVHLAHPIHGEVVRSLVGAGSSANHRRRLLELTERHGEQRRSDRIRAALWRLELGDTSDPGVLLTAADDLVALVDGDLAAIGDVADVAGVVLLEQAEQLARAALDAGAGIDAATRVLWLLSRLGRPDEARTVRATLDELVAGETEQVLAARLLADVDSLILGDARIAIARLRELEAIVTAPSLLRTLRASRANALAVSGEQDEALQVARCVLADPDAAAGERVRATAAAAMALGLGGHTADALDLLDSAATLATDDIGLGMMLVPPRVFVLGCAGHLDELDELLADCYRTSEQHGLHDGIAVFGAAIAGVAVVRGRPRSAVSWASTALAHLGDVDPYGIGRLALAARAHGSALVGDTAGALADIDALDGLGAASVFRDDETRARAWTQVAAGRTDLAIELLLTNAELAAGRGHVVAAAGHLHDVARLDGAGVVSERIAAVAAAADGPLLPALAAHVAGLVSADAEGVERAGTELAQLGATLLGAEAFAQAAAIHRRAGRHARSGAAATESRRLRQACEGATTPALLGAEPLASLTRREREIAQLAAAGHTDRHIADSLVVSIRTVQTHLYNTYAKLGITGREGLPAALTAER